MSLLFSKTTLGPLELQNRIVMSPMTRSRAIGNVPNDLMVEYYAQRATVGAIITEGVAPSPNALGYARIPGIFSAEQTAGWKKITDAVHAKGAKMIIQFMHTGRVGHPANLPAGAKVVGPSAVAAAGDMWTDSDGMQPMPTPEVIDVKATIAEHVQAAKNAMAAGFDAVELHGANGYLIEQFIRPNSNTRTDEYGGGIEGRARFMLEVIEAVSAAIGKDRLGIRLSPYGVFNDMPLYPEMDADYLYIAEKLAGKLLYVHFVNHSSMGAPEVPAALTDGMRKAFKGPIILSGGYFTAERAEADLEAGKGDLVAFGRAALANPDLVERLKTGAALNEAKMDSFYTPGPEGYTDYPTLAG